MAKSAKRNAKAKSTPSPSTSSGSSTPSSRSSAAGPLPPFVKASASLEPFLAPLSTSEVYLVHIDGTSPDVKKQTFSTSVVLNVVIIAIITLRVYMGLYTYPDMLASLFGQAAAVDTATSSWGELVWIILKRTGTILLDYCIVVLFASWPVEFVRGPVYCRRTIGFREHEVIVRRSKPSWSAKLERNRWIRDDEATRDRIVAAVTPDRIAKTGHLLSDADWDLDYDAMLRAHVLVDATRKGEGVPLDEFRTAVLVHTDADGWLIWHVGDQDTTAAGRTRSTQRDQILAFRDKLVAMGKEDLFFRWVELIQYESTQPGGFTPDRQRAAMLQAKKLFEDANVDFARFWQDVGGMEGIPELD
ncbi:hypothetical protein ASPZODRAFT_57030 [Penicilliopsis zonata CBS 506.65]|uniref:Uncharacterized protein n=1 Tax=Penicilliopsis zonata CBS 506.65 TaxID=1073090 RepID=A0A1L9SWI1_9EURO|nr:hypothetical protein ASPZODRAFT_57030 [Penicilliopsis zonata CBS 506.65]OJJ51562.1 hypothetical protein ASPZODRAFT_57030 [Penicilliopsis zonata CBS 506.65]